MARGETRGQRRRRRRRERTAAPPYPDHSKSPPDRTELRTALDGRVGWVKAVWATPARRLALSAGWVALATWILAYALTDPGGYFGHWRSAAGFVVAPGLLLAFGAQFAEAARDLATGRNSSVPVFHRIGWWLDRRGLIVVAVYLAAMVAALLALTD